MYNSEALKIIGKHLIVDRIETFSEDMVNLRDYTDKNIMWNVGLENDYDVKGSFIKLVDDFDPEREADFYWNYPEICAEIRSNFTKQEVIEDFKRFQNKLEKIKKELIQKDNEKRKS